MFGADRNTHVEIDGDAFLIDGEPTYRGVEFEGMSVEGRLLNARMIQALFDDENPETVGMWAYPDTGEFEPERNVEEFLAAMPEWYDHGLRAITINLQCGSPEGYSDEQPWHVSAYESDGTLKESWLDRLDRVLAAADELGMVVFLGCFYFGADELEDEAAVVAGVENILDWLFEREYANVVIEVDNECNVSRYEHDILRPPRVAELIDLVADTERKGHSYPVGTSFNGGAIPTPEVVAASDVVFVHGNSVEDPRRIGEMVEEVRAMDAYHGQPIVFNEDDHFRFDERPNNMQTAIEYGASWGYFDPGENNYRDGYQSPPVNWEINTERKRAFFDFVAQVSGND